MEIEVLLFASLKEQQGSPSLTVTVEEGATVARLREVVAESYPELAPGLAASRVAIDQEFSPEDRTIVAGAEVALIPPVSGG